MAERLTTGWFPVASPISKLKVKGLKLKGEYKKWETFSPKQNLLPQNHETTIEELGMMEMVVYRSMGKGIVILNPFWITFF